MDDLITRNTEAYCELRKKLSQTLQIVERLIDNHHPSVMNEVYLTGEEVRTMFCISKQTLQTYRDGRIIPYTKFGGKYLYPQSAILELLQAHYVKAMR